MSEDLYQVKERYDDARRYWRYVRCSALPKVRMALSAFSAAAAYAVPSDTLKIAFAAVAAVSGTSAAREYFVRDTWNMSGFLWTKIAWKNLRQAEYQLKILEMKEEGGKNPAASKNDFFMLP